MEPRTSSDFKVRFSADVAGVLECDDATGRIEFALGAGSKGEGQFVWSIILPVGLADHVTSLHSSELSSS
jgi:hypothetical protein